MNQVKSKTPQATISDLKRLVRGFIALTDGVIEARFFDDEDDDIWDRLEKHRLKLYARAAKLGVTKERPE